jgi:putative ABC transport system ATP-binding protein
MALIEARDLTKTYTMGDQTVHALRGVSLDIEAGGFLAIWGRQARAKARS